MDLLFPDDGLVEQLRRILTPGVTFRLYTSPATVDLSITLAGLVEASWSGYVPQPLHWSDFAAFSGVSGHNGYAVAPALTFHNTSGSTVQPYGYFVTDTLVSPTMILAIAEFDNAPVSIVPGGTTVVLPTWGDISKLAT